MEDVDIDGDIILRSIECKINNFMHKYEERPRYIKVPIWVKIRLIEYAKEMLTNFNCNIEDLEEKEPFFVLGVQLCPSITISSLQEIEVF